MKTNFHTHSTWCDGKNTPEEMIRAALDKGFDALGFSSHACFEDFCPAFELNAARAMRYAAEIRALAAHYAPRLRILCGVEHEYIEGATRPDRARQAGVTFDYVIGSVHFVVAPDGTRVEVDNTPEILAAGIRDHFGDSSRAFVCAYFEQERRMVAGGGFDIVGHPDLVRKFNAKHPYFDEGADWYRAELARTADALAAAGKIVEVNTGAISRGWLDDAYPSAEFRALLRARGVRFILNSDAHSATGLDCAFDRFVTAETYTHIPANRT